MSGRRRFSILLVIALLVAGPGWAQSPPLPSTGRSCPIETLEAGQPEKYKTALVTWLAIYPLVLGAAWATKPLVGGTPLPVRVAAITLLVVPAMTWVAMPRLTTLFHGWLRP